MPDVLELSVVNEHGEERTITVHVQRPVMEKPGTCQRGWAWCVEALLRWLPEQADRGHVPPRRDADGAGAEEGRAHHPVPPGGVSS